VTIDPGRRTTVRRRTEAQMMADIEREAATIGVPPPRPERRCRVCKNPDSRDRVNRLLAYGMGPSEIVDYCADLNELRPDRDQITYWSVYAHSRRHFNIQAPANASYRRILERHVRAHADEFVGGVENLLTVYGFLEVVAQKGFETLMNPSTTVDYTKGLDAMLTLHNLTRDGDADREVAELRRQVGLLQKVVLEEADEDTRRRIVARIDELTGPSQAIDADVIPDDDEGYGSDDAIEPDLDVDFDDSLDD
jgi:hypothetical protein